ncbi:DUF4197 domain-containing protein [Bacteriovoracaceae bacterium]|nr:DUF4197 domain-containing protein [Bacteriovoracaceae bacterium]
MNLIIIGYLTLAIGGCAQLADLSKNVDLSETSEKIKPLSQEEIVLGLKEALKVSLDKSVKKISIADGFWKNDLIKLPFPEEAIEVKKRLSSLGMGKEVLNFEKNLNRAAEKASGKSMEIFLSAITQLTFDDVMKIYKGDKDAATNFLKDKTSEKLYAEFKPVAKKVIDEVDVTKYWKPVISNYNKIPFVENYNPDLDDYVTKKTIQGLFSMISLEEAKIRKDPKARITDLLERVFGQL